MSKKKVATEAKAADRKCLSKKIRFEVLKRDSFKCQYCGASAPEVLLQVDHIKAVADGGEDDIFNLVTSCQPCNSGKSDRSLSDNAVLAKSKRQLDELQDRREQIEMLMEWKSGLRILADETLDHVCAMCSRYMMDRFTPSPQMRHKLGSLLSRHGFELLTDSISASATQYLKADGEGLITPESAGIFLEKIGAICTVKSRTGNSPEGQEIYMLRGLLAHRFKEHDAMYYDHSKALERLRECVFEYHIPIRVLREVVSHCKRWSQFMADTQGLINQVTGVY